MNKKTQPVQPIRPAATIIVVRNCASGFEIFMLKRTNSASFASGMFVFPGGRVDGDDHLHKYDAYRHGPLDAQDYQIQQMGYEWRGFWIAAIRETFEEAGILLAYRDGTMLDFSDERELARFDAYRDPLHAGELSLLDVCAEENLQLALDQVHYYNRFVTPLGRPRRFDTRFFVALAPDSQSGAHDRKETVDSVWITPERALERHQEGDFGLMNVTRIQLEALAAHADTQGLLDMVSAERRIPVRRPVVPV